MSFLVRFVETVGASVDQIRVNLTTQIAKVVLPLGVVAFLAFGLFPLLNRTETEFQALSKAAQVVAGYHNVSEGARAVSVTLSPLVSARVVVTVRKFFGEPPTEPPAVQLSSAPPTWVVPSDARLIVRWDFVVVFLAAIVIFYVAIRTLQPREKKEKPKALGLSLDQKYSSEQYLIVDVERALERSEELFSRSTLLLVGGVVMAFVGVFVFFISLDGGSSLIGGSALEAVERPVSVDDLLVPIEDRLFQAFKSTAMLVFIEAIAWFLLRQYRVLIEDYKSFYRFYMKRANYLTVLKLVTEGSDKAVTVTLLVNALLAEDFSGRLKQGESTEGLEGQKLIDQSFAEFALARLADVAGKVVPKSRDAPAKEAGG